MLFSQGVSEGKKLIQRAIKNGEIPQSRVEESVKKILLTKYFLGLNQYTSKNPGNINSDLNNDSHKTLVQNLYANALTLLKDDQKLLPVTGKQVYYVPLEEAPYQTFANQLGPNIMIKKANEINTIPAGSTVIVGFHKDNSTAYKPYKISAESKRILADLTKSQNVILNVFGSAYALKDIDITKVSTVLISYENNDDSMTAAANALNGKTKIWGRLPVLVNDQLKAGMGIDSVPASGSNMNTTVSTTSKQQ
jgi:hypothetical protein